MFLAILLSQFGDDEEEESDEENEEEEKPGESKPIMEKDEFDFENEDDPECLYIEEHKKRED